MGISGAMHSDGSEPTQHGSTALGADLARPIGQPAVVPSGGCSSTRGRYSTSGMLPSKVRLSIISSATSE